MEKDTRRLALISVGLGIGMVTLLPVHAGLAQGFRPDALSTLGTVLLGNLRATDVLDILLNIVLFLPLGYFVTVTVEPAPESHGTATRGRRLGLAGLSGLVLIIVLEGIQIWIPGRFCSVVDVFTNGLGAVLGGWAAIRAPVGESG